MHLGTCFFIILFTAHLHYRHRRSTVKILSLRHNEAGHAPGHAPPQLPFLTDWIDRDENDFIKLLMVWNVCVGGWGIDHVI